MNRIIKVLVVQQINRAYRVPLLTKLAELPGIELTMVYGTSVPVQAGDIGISIAEGPLPFRTISGPIQGIRCKGREILWFGLALDLIKREYFDVVICDYYIRLISIWPMQSHLHSLNSAFILWGIGFHQYPTPFFNKIRMQLIKRTDALILYSEKEKLKYGEMGVPLSKCFVATNTVDVEGIEAALKNVTEDKILRCQQAISYSGQGPVLMHVGRIAQNKRLDLLIKLVAKLQTKYPGLQLLLIGEGPEKQNLMDLANLTGVADRIHFLGSITVADELAPWMLISDLVVAPGQIGLQAPMTLVYGKTLVCSDDPSLHGPEVQAVVDGKTGFFYSYNHIDDLVQKTDRLLSDRKLCYQLAVQGKKYVIDKMNTGQMLEGFIQAISFVSNTRS